MNDQRMKPKKAVAERIATITPIATRNTPFTISLMMPQRMPNTPKAVRTIKPHIASPMYCAICLKFAVAVIAVLFVKFHDAVNPAVKETAECGLVGSLVFRPVSVLLHNVGSENVGEVKHPPLQGYCALEIGIAVHVACKPILFLSAQFFTVVEFGAKSVHLGVLQVLQTWYFPCHEFYCYCCPHIRCFLIFNADSRAEGVEFQTILSASRLSDIFFMRLSVASVVFVSGA
ncbi:hypothetical protein PRABACTJOHN_04542 [Parabacteroides johnsonii DSM 18315]|uniref:Uncharacterized protein n=1 Tax=Parabacteroides johnsonii DSM 18315 TaxID=537006 RepID=B7BHJ2_9BACT|nr:hypothetical protein PRABACTJOHN_04542 [Parabacteroides johnsonii DSM 18315]